MVHGGDEFILHDLHLLARRDIPDHETEELAVRLLDVTEGQLHRQPLRTLCSRLGLEGLADQVLF